MEKKKNSKILKKPNPLVYYPVGLIVGAYTKLLGVRYDRSGLKGIKGPAVVLANHVSNYDFLYVGIELMPKRPTYVVSQHFIENPVSRFWLGSVHVIPKKMFCPDIRTVKNILRAKDSGNIIVLFPEGRLGCYGHSQTIADGTAELLKKLGVDVYHIVENGGYKALPKWGKAGFRRGPLEITASKLFDAEEFKSLTVGEIEAKLNEAVDHDEDLTFEGETYKCKSPALGLDGVLYKCPSCGEEFKMLTDDRHIFCEACGFKAELNEKYEFTGAPFKSINEWYFWQEAQIDLNAGLETDCVIRTKDGEGNKVDAGTGHIAMSPTELRFAGTAFGEPLEFAEIPLKIHAFPSTVSDHFDLYSGGVLYSVVPTPDARQSMKWVSYLDRLVKEQE